MDNLQGHCTIEPLAPDDLLDALRSLKGSHAEGVFVPAPGNGPEKLMGWALKEIQAASAETDPENKDRNSTNAVMNARRALSCMVDWYLRRDGFVFCKNPPKGADAKAEILVRRRIVEDLSTRVLARAIDIRNQSEHKYQAVSVDQAEDVVELIRLSIQSMRTRSEPDCGPFIYGTLLGGTSYGENGYRGMFYGWDSPIAVLNTFATEPWIGVIVPTSKTNAIARKALLNGIQVELLLESINLLERTFGVPSGGSNVAGCTVRAAAAGFS